MDAITPPWPPDGTAEGVESADGSGAELWRNLREEAGRALAAAPALRSLFLDAILDRSGLTEAVLHRIASRLTDDLVPRAVLLETFRRAADADPTIGAGLVADLRAVMERDPAATRLIEPFLYFKGFHALQLHRINHHLWFRGERDLALYLQSRSSEVFQTDIHPAARFGRGLFLDHATGLVVGETTVIEDEVSLLQDVTLGGTGKAGGDRHPKIRRGAIIGAGAKVLGNIEVGERARVAAGSVVLAAVAARATVAGIPARPVRARPVEDEGEPSEVLRRMAHAAFDYVI